MPYTATHPKLMVQSCLYFSSLWPRPTEEIVPKDAFSLAHTTIRWWFVLFARPGAYIIWHSPSISTFFFSKMPFCFQQTVVVVVVVFFFRHHNITIKWKTRDDQQEFYRISAEIPPPPLSSSSDNRCNRFKTKNFYYIVARNSSKRDEIINLNVSA